MRKLLFGFLALCAFASAAPAQERFITVASTTSTEQSGLFGYLLPTFTEEDRHRGARRRARHRAGARSRRGAAMPMSCSCTTSPRRKNSSPKAAASKRFDVMYNDFVIVGPKSDPAKIAGSKDVLEALRKIAAAKAPFISRGDRSGTHQAELRYWKAAAIDINAVKGDWYREIGQGMGPALNMASAIECLCAVRPRHLAVVQESRRPHRSWSKATSGCSTNTG